MFVKFDHELRVPFDADATAATAASATLCYLNSSVHCNRSSNESQHYHNLSMEFEFSGCKRVKSDREMKSKQSFCTDNDNFFSLFFSYIHLDLLDLCARLFQEN